MHFLAPLRRGSAPWPVSEMFFQNNLHVRFFCHCPTTPAPVGKSPDDKINRVSLRPDRGQGKGPVGPFWMTLF